MIRARKIVKMQRADAAQLAGDLVLGTLTIGGEARVLGEQMVPSDAHAIRVYWRDCVLCGGKATHATIAVRRGGHLASWREMRSGYDEVLTYTPRRHRCPHGFLCWWGHGREHELKDDVCPACATTERAPSLRDQGVPARAPCARLDRPGRALGGLVRHLTAAEHAALLRPETQALALRQRDTNGDPSKWYSIGFCGHRPEEHLLAAPHACRGRIGPGRRAVHCGCEGFVMPLRAERVVRDEEWGERTELWWVSPEGVHLSMRGVR